MFEQAFDISELIAAELRYELTADQRVLLDNWLNAAEVNRALYLRITQEQYFQQQISLFRGTDSESIRRRTLDKIAVQRQSIMKSSRPKIFSINYRVAIAVAVAVLIFGAGLFYFNSHQSADRQAVFADHDITPGKEGATLILANGKTINIAAAATGKIAELNGIRISKNAKGQLLYEAEAGQAEGEGFNTLQTGNGQQIQLLLPDHSLVYLNAGSSIKYPVSFSKLKQRRVMLSGEGYFEVVKDRKRAFVVETKQQELEVLGTHFNVNAYPDVSIVKTTLFEGSVKLSAAKKQVVLKPGEQVQWSGNTFSLNPEADLEEALAWKNGYFKFNENLETIMAKVARWYDVEIVYDKKPDPDLLFEGKISRARNISAVLRIMESTGNVHFKIEGRRIRVME